MNQHKSKDISKNREEQEVQARRKSGTLGERMRWRVFKAVSWQRLEVGRREGGERATREWERLNTEEGKGENNQERKNEGKKDGDGGGGGHDVEW